jgi:hypothetical protein
MGADTATATHSMATVSSRNNVMEMCQTGFLLGR